MNVQTFKTVYKSIFDAMDIADRRIGFAASGMAVSADSGGSLEVSVGTGDYVKNSETSLTAFAGGKVSLSAADPVNSRVDIVYISSLGVLTAASGTAAASNPVPPAWSAGGTPLAIAFVPPAATTFATGGYVGAVQQFAQIIAGGTPSVALAAVAAAGSAPRFLRADAQIAAFDAISPGVTSLGLAAGSLGTTSFAARSNHVHAQPFIGCRVFHSTNQTASAGGAQALLFNSERFDTDTMHSSTASTTKIKFKTPGKYDIGAHAEGSFLAQASILFELGIRLNGATFVAKQAFTPTSPFTLSVVTTYDMVSTDYAEAVINNTTVSNVSINAAGNYSPEFWAKKVG